MLKRFLWTFFIMALLGVYVYYTRSLKQHMEMLESISNSESLSPTINHIPETRVAAKPVKEPLAISADKKIRDLSSRKPSTADSIDSFYKEANQQKQQQAIKESEFLKKFKRVPVEYYHNSSLEKWTLIKDVFITLEKESLSLLPFGPYKIVESPKQDMPHGKLIYSEDQKKFAILTGRIITQLNNLFESDQISKDYGWLVENVNTDIKTVYYKSRKEIHLGELRQLMSSDSRIHYFYFETVHNQWQKN